MLRTRTSYSFRGYAILSEAAYVNASLRWKKLSTAQDSFGGWCASLIRFMCCRS